MSTKLLNDQSIAIVEIGGSHDECLLSQFVAIKNAGGTTYLISTQDIWNRNRPLQEWVDIFHPVVIQRKAWADWRTMRKLNAFFVKEKISKVIFNTAQGAHIRNICILAPREVEFIGIIHTARKFQHSFTQRIINWKIKKYFVLNDFFLDRIAVPKGIKVESFYPLRFPEFRHAVEKKKGECWITITGGVENRRKDLFGSIELMKTLLHLPVRFVFLGKADPLKDEVKEFLLLLDSNGLTGHVTLFHEFVSEEMFDAYLLGTDFIWPMVHPNTPSSDEYFKNQITGGMNISFAYRIPMLVHEDYVSEWRDLSYSFGYNLGNFSTQVEKALPNKDEMVRRLGEEPRFNFEFQEDKYVQFLLK